MNTPYFFFQAEDGIRDYKVTGVQTCALPISAAGEAERQDQREPGEQGPARHATADPPATREPRARRASPPPEPVRRPGAARPHARRSRRARRLAGPG